MRSVIEQSQPRPGRVPKVDNVQRSRFLIEVIAITTRIEAKKRAEQKPNRRLVRNNQDVFAWMAAHELDKHRQSARRHRETAFAADRCERVWILLPFRRFLRKLFFH